jgi:uncharacterized membrane protein YphA (DoxX/SURF4 family)
MKPILKQRLISTGKKFITKNITVMKLNIANIGIWLLRILAAVIMLQTLYFKFTANPQSVKLFTELGMEPCGRIGTGVFELIASLLILIPRTTILGAALGLALMSGAIYFHLTKLGIYFDGDPVLFIYAVTVFVCCAALVIIHRKDLFTVLHLNNKPKLYLKK